MRFGPSGGVAWFPLAPGEPYVPAYHASRRYLQQVNITNVNITKVNVTNVNVTDYHYRNRGLDGAVTAVSHDEFVAGRAKHGAPVVLHEQDIKGATVLANAAPIAPRPQNVVTRGETRPASWTPYHVQPAPNTHPASQTTASRTFVTPAPHPDQAQRQQQERQLDAKQVREHAQIQEQQEQERRATQTEAEQTALKEKQQKETQEMETRHQQQLQALPPKPATPATAPRHPMTPTHAPNVDKKAPEKSAKPQPEKPASPPAKPPRL
jgi:hypothetical protein